MAQAPLPGVSARKDSTDAAQRVLVVRLRDETFKIAAGNVPLRVKDRFMRDTGRSLEWYFNADRVNDVALCALWFLSKLIDGQDITWDQVLDEWDAAAFTADDVEVIDETARPDDPEV